MVLIDVTLGDLVDRLTILELKAARRPDRFGKNLSRLRDALPVHFDAEHLTELRAINAELWDVEDRIRALIAAGDYGNDFIDVALAVPRLNDARARARARVDGDDLDDKLYACPGAAGGPGHAAGGPGHAGTA
jgi:hypothetical protein